METNDKTDLKGLTPESWLCIDCEVNTAPGMLSRAELESAIEAAKKAGKWEEGQGIEQTIDDKSEVYTVRDAVWKEAGMEPMAGCLCIGCLEKRLDRSLRPKDFQRNHPFSHLPGTARLLKRRKDRLRR